MRRRTHHVIQVALSGIVLLSAALVCGPAAHAQALTVQWDSLGGDPVRPLSDGVAVSPDVYGDTLFATSRGDLFRLLPDEATFGPEISETNNPGPGTGIEITEEGYMLTEDGDVSYSTDGGVRWVNAAGLEDMGFANDIHQTR
ncbi:MAG: hypothetical protein AAGN64_02760, partial [Bacteroidota bacterium]